MPFDWAERASQPKILSWHRDDDAIALGANELPAAIRKIMAFTSKIMVKTAYWV